MWVSICCATFHLQHKSHHIRGSKIAEMLLLKLHFSLALLAGLKNFHWTHWINCRVLLMPTWLDPTMECGIRPEAGLKSRTGLKPSAKPYGKSKTPEAQYMLELGLTSLKCAVSDSTSLEFSSKLERYTCNLIVGHKIYRQHLSC